MTRRASLEAIFRWLARLFFSLTVVTIPFRYRFILVERPFPPIYQDYTYVLLYISDLFQLGLLISWLASLGIRPRPIRPGPLFLTLPILGLTVAGAVSTLFSIDASISLYHTVRLGLLALFYFYIINEINSPKQLVWPLAIQVWLQAVVGVLQVLRQGSQGLERFGELALDPAWSGVSVVWAGELRWLRAYGLTDHPNILGGSLAFALLLLAGWYVSNRHWAKALVSGVFTLGSLALFFTFSRAAWLAMAAGMGLVASMLIYGMRRGELINLLGLWAATAIVLVPFFWQNSHLVGIRLNFQGSFESSPAEIQSIGERALLNRAANQIFSRNALTGVGLGAFPLALREAYPDLPVDYQPAHLALLDAAAETGILGALFYTLALATPWLAILFLRKRLNFSPAFISACGLLMAVTVVGFFDYYTWLLTAGRLWQWLSWGLWAVTFGVSLEDHRD